MSEKQKYKLMKEKLDFELTDREHKLTLDGYQESGRRIIIGLRNANPDLNNLTIEEFKERLEDYMSGSKGYNKITGIKRVFLNDIVYKWASEMKKWD